MIVWSVASTVLVGLAQRFTITGRNDVYSGQSAPLAKPMRSRAVSPARSAELYFFLLLLGAVVVTGIDARTAQALDAKAINDGSPGHAWCITRDGSGAPAACDYDNFLVCGMAAIVAGGSCKARSSLFTAAVEVRCRGHASYRRPSRLFKNVSLPRPRAATTSCSENLCGGAASRMPLTRRGLTRRTSGLNRRLKGECHRCAGVSSGRN